MIYIFDIDGTLTPSRNKMDENFHDFFMNFVKIHRVWLISGSDHTKTIEQTENNYEEVFVRFRDLLTDKPWCCDSREDVLSMCQALADSMRKNLLIRRGG